MNNEPNLTEALSLYYQEHSSCAEEEPCRSTLADIIIGARMGSRKGFREALQTLGRIPPDEGNRDPFTAFDRPAPGLPSDGAA